MITVSALALLISAGQSATPTWFGQWTGHYQFADDPNSKEYRFEIAIDEKGKVIGTYDFTAIYGTDWHKGGVHGDVKETGEYKIFFKSGDKPSWAQVVGKLIYDDKDKKLTDTSATHSFPTPDPDERKRHPRSVEIHLKRPSQ